MPPEPRRAKNAVQPAPFFALRTPLLSVEEALGAGVVLEAPALADDDPGLEAALERDRAALRARLATLLERPEVREALFVASPSLDEGIARWRRDPESEAGQKAERALVRYLARMAGRGTPFGLFAGCTTGRAGSATALELGPRETLRRHTRLDGDYLSALCAKLASDPAIRPHLTVRPNGTIYRVAERLRYIEGRSQGRDRAYHLVSVTPTPYLEQTLERARGGATPGALAAALVDDEAGIGQEDATAFLDELVDAGVLAPDLEPAVTGAEPIHDLLAQIEGLPQAEDARAALAEVRDRLAALDAAGLGHGPDPYVAIAARLDPLGAPAELPRLFQVDLVKPEARAALGPRVLREAAAAVALLHRVTPVEESGALKRFRARFQARYEDREVPLLEALDEEHGVGFGEIGEVAGDPSPLLRGLPIGRGPAEPTAPTGARHAWLLDRLGRALQRGEHSLELGPEDIEALEVAERRPLPDALALLGQVVAASAEAVDRGDFQLVVSSVSGPSGATLLGRFCHADPALHAEVLAHLRQEEARRPDAVFAEIVHLPAGRLGNVIQRPVLREREIVFLGRSGAPEARQIPVSDLRVSLRGDRIVLRSARLGREVLPRLTSALNTDHPTSQAAHRFLCKLAGQGAARALLWSWGALDASPFLPRVVSGRLVLSLARWRVPGARLRGLDRGAPADRLRAVRALRDERGVPRHVSLADGDNLLPLDLENALEAETFARLVARRSGVVLIERFPGPDGLCATGPEGRYCHEIVLPFLTADPAEPRASVPALDGGLRAARRALPPGSPWLYAKLYTGAATADMVLCELARPVVDRALEGGAADGWFFLRYGDPDWHVRLRLRGDPERLHAEVLPDLLARAEALIQRGLLWKLQLDTYLPEVERYGGPVGLELSERLFQADSEAVLAIVERLDGEAGLDARWRLALRGIDQLLGDLGLDLEGRLALMRSMREGYGQEFAVKAPTEAALGARFRVERASLEALLDPSRDAESDLAPGLEILDRRSEVLRLVARALREAEAAGQLNAPARALASSYVHMHTNRLLRSAARAQELVLYDLLVRLYSSRLARKRAGPPVS